MRKFLAATIFLTASSTLLMAETRNAADYLNICRSAETGDGFAEILQLEDGWQEVSVDFQSDERARQLYWQEGDVITPEFLISVSNFLNSKFRSISTPEKAERQLAEFNDPESFLARVPPVGRNRNERIFFHAADLKLAAASRFGIYGHPNRCFFASFSPQEDRSLFELPLVPHRAYVSHNRGAFLNRHEIENRENGKESLVANFIAMSGQTMEEFLGISLGNFVTFNAR